MTLISHNSSKTAVRKFRCQNTMCRSKHQCSLNGTRSYNHHMLPSAHCQRKSCIHSILHHLQTQDLQKIGRIKVNIAYIGGELHSIWYTFYGYDTGSNRLLHGCYSGLLLECFCSCAFFFDSRICAHLRKDALSFTVL